MCRNGPIAVASRWGAMLAVATAALFAQRVDACPLTRDECTGILEDAARLGGDLERLRRGERMIEVRTIEDLRGTRATQVAGSLVVVDAPPAAAWAVITDFNSWPRFVPHLAEVELVPDGDLRQSVVLRQDTRVFGFGFSATTRRFLDSDRRIVWDRLIPGPNDVDALSGFWQVLDLGDGRSLLRFQSRIALAASLPGVLESWLIEHGAPDALDAFAAEIERRQRADAGGGAG